MSTIFTIGCDPEVFVTKNGEPSSAYGLLKGTKEEPFKTDNGAYQVDGMAAEFNTDPVDLTNRFGYDSKLFAYWNKYIIEQIKEIRNALPDSHSVSIQPTMEFGKDFLDAQPDVAKELGCEPDYNAYTLEPNPRPDVEQTFRSGAGHIHIGWGSAIPTDNKDHIKICADFVKILDATVGMFMTYVDRDAKRRELYGKAGAFRPKEYGVEYRTPSNVWISNKDMRRAVWDLTRYAINYHRNQITSENIVSVVVPPQDIINQGNHKLAIAALYSIYHKQRQYMYREVYPAYMNRIIKTTREKYGDD